MQEVRLAFLTGFDTVKDVTVLVEVVLLLWLCVAGLDLIRQEDGSQLLLTNQMFLQFPVTIKKFYVSHLMARMPCIDSSKIQIGDLVTNMLINYKWNL